MYNLYAVVKNKIANGEELIEKELKCCAWGCVGNCIDAQEGDSGRWTKSISTIFEIDGQLYRIDWEQGINGYQDDRYLEQPYKVRKEEKIVTTTVVSYVKMED